MSLDRQNLDSHTTKTAEAQLKNMWSQPPQTHRTKKNLLPEIPFQAPTSQSRDTNAVADQCTKYC